MAYYILYGYSGGEYALPGPEIYEWLDPCERGNVQLLDLEPVDLSLDPEGGTVFPDLLSHWSGMVFVSPRLRTELLARRQEQVFFKPVRFVCPELGIREPYWLMLPPRINCLVWAKCEIAEYEMESTPFWARFYEVRKIVVDSRKTGRYGIFKLPPNTLNQEILVSDTLQDTLGKMSFSNLNFSAV